MNVCASDYETVSECFPPEVSVWQQIFFLVLSDRAGTEFQVLRHKCILLLLLCGVFSPQKCSSRHLSTKMSEPRKTGVGCYQDAPDKVFNDICQNVKVRSV